MRSPGRFGVVAYYIYIYTIYIYIYTDVCIVLHSSYRCIYLYIEREERGLQGLEFNDNGCTVEG